MFQYFYTKNIDIALTQETHSCSETEKSWRDEWDGTIYFSHGTSAARGACIFIRSHVEHEVHKEISDANGRYVILDITLDGTRLTLASIYAPNDDDPEFFIEVRNKIEGLTNDNRVIGGDINLVLDLLLDKKGGKNSTHTKAQKVVKDWMDSTDLVDAFRAQHPNDLKYTWSRSKPTKIFCRLDYFLVSQSLFDKVKSCDIVPGYNSDHSAVLLNIELNSITRGKGYWKMNCSYLNNPDYIELIKKTISHTAEINKEANPNLLWDTIKMSIRGESIKYGAGKKRYQNEQIIKLEKIIQYYEDLASDTNLTTDQCHQLNAHKLELDQIINSKAEGAYIRSRAQNYEEGERHSKYFFNIEKRNSHKKSINKLKTSANIITEDQTEILDEMKSFYKSLYSKQDLEDGSSFLNNLDLPSRMPQDTKNELMTDIDIDEVEKSMKLMQLNKSPGEDGLPIEFYRAFWHEIKNYLFNSYKYSLENGNLSITQKRGVISLLPKKNDLLLLKNWRPLTLLNVDYKILAKVIATRLKEALIHLINSDQTGFLEKRFIGHNIASLIEIIEFCEENDLAAVLLSIDFEKAFDKLDWDFLWKCMAFFEIPENIINWVKILYTGANSCVTNNGHMSNYFAMGRGVRQGCPLSPYLFIIAAEVLAISIRNNPDIKGITIGKKEYKIKQFADDSQTMSIYDLDSINATIKNFLDYGKVSGSTINYEKSADIMRIGSIRNTNMSLTLDYNVSWTNGPIEVLGITLSPDIKETAIVNYTTVLEKIKKTIELWSSQKLTLYGKMSIINTVLLSKLIYRFSSLPSPNERIVKSIEDHFLDFLWGSKKRHAISKNTITNSRFNFGLKFPCLRTKDKSLKVAWVKRILENEVTCISPFLEEYIPLDLHLFFQCNLKASDLNRTWRQKPSSFWIDVLTTWCDVNYRKPNEIEEPNNEILWFNSNIKIDGTVVFIETLYKQGVLKVGHLKKEDDSLLSYEEFLVKFPGTRIHFLQYLSIINAMPINYKNQLLVAHPKKSAIEFYLKVKKVPKKFYNTSIDKPDFFPSRAFERHARQLPNLEKDILKNSLEIMYTCTRSTKLRDFQYRLIHMTLTTNKEAFHYFKKVPSDRCTFCKTSQEDIHHILLYCKYTKTLWNNLQSFISRKTGINIHLSDQDKLFGNSQLPFPNLFNHILILTKQYIYACRCLDDSPDFTALERKIDREHRIELATYQRENLGVDPNRKWDPIYPP